MIRAASKKDISTVDKIWVETAQYHGALDSRLAMRFDDIDSITEFHYKQLKAKKTLFLVAEVEDEVVGFLIAHVMTAPPHHLTTKVGIIDGMAVTSTFRSQGIGSQLYERILEWFETQNVERIDTSVAAMNPKAQTFWERKGFSPRIIHISNELGKLAR